MINYDIDQRQKSTQQQFQFDLALEGLSDGSHGYPLQIKYMHEHHYIKSYVAGLTKWLAELERRETENYVQSRIEF